MVKLGRSVAFCFALGLSLWITACGGNVGKTNPPPPTTYSLTVNSTNPASGVAVTVSPADNNSASNGTTSFTRTYDAGASVTLTAPAASGGNTFSSWSGACASTTTACTVTMTGNATETANYVAPVQTYTLTVNSTNPSSGVAITVSPADNNSATNGATSFARVYNSGTPVTLTAPATASGNDFSLWSGCTSANGSTCTVTMSGNSAVTANYSSVAPIITPTVTVTPSATSVARSQPLMVTVAVSGGTGNPEPTGSVTLTSGTYTSAATTLTGGSAQIDIPAGSLTDGSDTLTATYTPDAASSTIYNSATGRDAVTVIAASTVTVSTPNSPVTVTDQILGMNMAAWYDIVTNETAIVDAFRPPESKRCAGLADRGPTYITGRPIVTVRTLQMEVVHRIPMMFLRTSSKTLPFPPVSMLR
ncbi:MAG: hypothetical protein ABR905_15455 [Terracidiphilus sp.]|jgi:hypothetical protein